MTPLVEALCCLREVTSEAIKYGPNPSANGRYVRARTIVQQHAQAYDEWGRPWHDDLAGLLEPPTLDILMRGRPGPLLAALDRAIATATPEAVS